MDTTYKWRMEDGGWGIPPQATNLTAIPGDGKVTLNWSVPETTTIEEQEVCRTKGIKILKKLGGFPENENDGNVVVDSTTLRGSFEDTGLTNETQYYYRAFAYSDHNVINRSPSAQVAATPTEQEVATVSVATSDGLSVLPDGVLTHVEVEDTTSHTTQTGDIQGGIGSTNFNISVGHDYTVTISLKKAHYSIVDGQIVITYEDVPSAVTETKVYVIGEATKGPFTAVRGNTRSIAFELEAITIVTWASGTNEEVAAMVAAAQAGLIDLSDYWSVGDERTVHLSAMTATGVGEAQAEQDVTMVLMHAGGVPLAAGGECNFVVGQKNALTTNGYMNSSNTNAGSWGDCKRRTWCNEVYFNALPTYFKNMLLTMKTKTPTTETGSEWQEVEDKVALPSVAQVWDAKGSYMNANEFLGDLVQFDWYKTAANRIKKAGNAGSAVIWWERSPSDYSSNRGQCFCSVGTGGSANGHIASGAYGVAPFGCI